MQDNARPDRWTQNSRFRTAAALVFIALCNLVTFNRHYSGKATFPWDFLGGYHAQAYGWYDTGSIFAPATWFPWTNLGFPGFLSIQSGGWYLPLAFLSALGIEYTVPVATAVQALHVLWAAIGMFLLLRRLGLPVLPACIGAIAYHFNAAFFANQQHVDIVRAAAWLPWLLWAFTPETLRGRLGAPAAALILSQFLVSAYPGAIVSFAYLMIFWVGILLLRSRLSGTIRDYSIVLVLSTLAGILLAMPKWAPFLLNGSTGLARETFAVPVLDLTTLYTFALPYLSDLIPGDPTMRAFWLPLPILWGLAFVSLRDHMVRVGLGFVVLGFFFCLVVPRVESLAQILPGIGISRFPLADWRPVIHMGIIIAGSLGISRLREGCFQAKAMALRLGLAGLIVAGVVSLAIERGFLAHDVLLIIKIQAALSILGLLMIAGGDLPARWMRIAGPMLVLLTAFNGYRYHADQRLTWRPTWDEVTEGQSFGGRMEDFTRDKKLSSERRPARFLYGGNIPDAVTLRDSGFYNRCWYSRSYCVFGYDNLRLSTSHALLMNAVVGSEGGALMEFIQRPHQLFLADPSARDTITPLALDTAEDPAVGDVASVSVKYRRYASSEIVYDISTPSSLRVIENEIGWPGWEITACRQDGCNAPIPASSTSQGLRTFVLPQGRWTITERYSGPAIWPGYLLALLGGLIATTISLFRIRGASRRPSDRVAG